MIKNLSEYFLPEHQFYLQNVSYNKIDNNEVKEEYSLNCFDSIKADVEGCDEVRNNGEFVTNNLMARISLLIAQITTSFGQSPIILPPNVAKEI